MGVLPQGFDELLSFAADWDLPSVNERYQRRKTMSQKELVRFYRAALPRMDDMLTHLDPFDIYHLPEAERSLYRLLCGLCEASAAVELIGEPYVVPPEGHDVVYLKTLPEL